VLGQILECGTVCLDRYFIVERCVGTYISVWNGEFRPIVVCGAVCWDR